ncbi:Hypothetical protein A7982_10651 [Minicystis rosea]|nr:Hypothetical protein A7982_10651 [Minicystis rosea]
MPWLACRGFGALVDVGLLRGARLPGGSAEASEPSRPADPVQFRAPRDCGRTPTPKRPGGRFVPARHGFGGDGPRSVRPLPADALGGPPTHRHGRATRAPRFATRAEAAESPSAVAKGAEKSVFLRSNEVLVVSRSREVRGG